MAPNPITKHRRNLANPEPEPTTTSDLDLTLKKKHNQQQHPDPKNPKGPSFFMRSKLGAHSQAKSLNRSAEFDQEKLSYMVKQQHQQQQGKHSKKGCAQEVGKVGGKEGVDIEVKLRRKFEEWEDLGKKLKEKEKVGALVIRKEGLRKSCDGEVESGGVRRKTTAASLIVNGGVGGRRRSFGGVQVELSDVFTSNGARVVSVDMPPLMQIHAVDCARKTSDSMEKFSSKTLALALKKEFDGVYGPAWHCIVGTSFGSFVTHSVGGFVYFAMDQKMYILLFKTTVQRAD